MSVVRHHAHPQVLAGSNPWYLELSMEGSWTPSWRDPLIAVVVVTAVIVLFLSFAVLYGRHRFKNLLKQMLPSKAIRVIQV